MGAIAYLFILINEKEDVVLLSYSIVSEWPVSIRLDIDLPTRLIMVNVERCPVTWIVPSVKQLCISDSITVFYLQLLMIHP